MSELDISIVLESDNAVKGGLDRMRMTVAALSHELSRCDRTSEVIVVFNGARSHRSSIAEVVRTLCPPGVPLAIVEEPGSSYYTQKNAGAKRARGEIVVFLDSDTVPEPGWLDQLLSPFDDSNVHVVGGTCFTEYETTVDKAFALTWNFPLRAADGPPFLWHHFNANLVAFRRLTFERHPFPEDQRFRGQCHSLACALIANDIDIVINPRARVGHPAPCGIRYITERAMCQGHDRMLTYRMGGGNRGVVQSLRVLGYDVRGSMTRIVRDHRKVGLSVPAIPVAIAVASWYHAWSWLGWTVTRLRPELIRRSLYV